MLEIQYDDGSKRGKVLCFEHSLLSLSKWESDFKKPFLSQAKDTLEMIDYFGYMLLNPRIDPSVVYGLSPEQLEKVGDYINDSRTAAMVPEDTSKSRVHETLTSDLIYYWLTELGIPFHPTETWHVNRTMMLVQITAFKRQPEKKRPAAEIAADYNTINERQKKLFKTKG